MILKWPRIHFISRRKLKYQSACKAIREREKVPALTCQCTVMNGCHCITFFQSQVLHVTLLPTQFQNSMLYINYSKYQYKMIHISCLLLINYLCVRSMFIQNFSTYNYHNWFSNWKFGEMCGGHPSKASSLCRWIWKGDFSFNSGRNWRFSKRKKINSLIHKSGSPRANIPSAF